MASESARVFVNQAGGKYGAFLCPVCTMKADWNFSSSTGWCCSCLAQFFYSGGFKLYDAKSEDQSSHYILAETEKCNFDLSGIAFNLFDAGGYIEITKDPSHIRIHFNKEHGALAFKDPVKSRIEAAVERHFKQGQKTFSWAFHESNGGTDAPH